MTTEQETIIKQAAQKHDARLTLYMTSVSAFFADPGTADAFIDDITERLAISSSAIYQEGAQFRVSIYL